MSSKSQLVLLFEQGDTPQGSNFADLINSSVNMFETGTQAILGPINPTELITARVSATNGVFTGTMNIAGITSARDLYAETITASAYAGAIKYSGAVVSALGSTQATAAPLTVTINRGAGVVDGQTTGFILQANQTNRIQYIINGGASANLWPCVGGQINALASNAAFAMAANIQYTIIHTAASGYSVK